MSDVDYLSRIQAYYRDEQRSYSEYLQIFLASIYEVFMRRHTA